MGDFQADRGHCLLENERFREASEAYAWAATLEPNNQLQFDSLDVSLKRWYKKLTEMTPPMSPPVRIVFPPRRFPVLPDDIEKEMIHFRVREDLLKNAEFQKLCEHLRRSPHLRPASQVTVRCGLMPNFGVPYAPVA